MSRFNILRLGVLDVQQAGAYNGRLHERGKAGWMAVLSGVLLLFSFPVFPHFQIWPLAWIALIPLLLQLQRSDWKRALFLGAAFGYPLMVGVLAWMKGFGWFPWFFLVFFEGAWFLGFTLMTSLISPIWSCPSTLPARRTEKGRENRSTRRERRSARTSRPGADRKAGIRTWPQHLAAALLPGCAWIFFEWMRSLGSLSIPWGFISHTQVHFAALVSTARWWGAYGVSFWIVAVNAAAANCIASAGPDRHRAARALAVIAAVVPTACTISMLTLATQTHHPLKVALVQGDLLRSSTSTVTMDPQTFRKEVLASYINLTRQAAREHPAIIVWPETAVPGPLILDPELYQVISNLARETGATMVLGSPHFTVEGSFNSAFVMATSGEILGRYDKEHIVPFGEYVPFLKRLAISLGAPSTDLVRGRGHFPVDSREGKLGIMICYESMYPQIARQTVLHGADMLVVVTNDQWYGNSSAPYDHASDAPFRAAETGRWLAQGGTTGISLFADPGGRVYQPTRMFTQGVDIRDIYPRSEITLYTRLGDWPPILSAVILIGALSYRILCRRRTA